MAARRDFPLTSYQRDIWAVEFQTPNSPQFNVVIDERTTGPVDAAALRTALGRALARHDVFRLRFGERDGVPYQWTADETTTWTTTRTTDGPAGGGAGGTAGDSGPGEAVAWVDLSGEAEPERAWEAWREESFTRPFPLLGAPLFRAAVVRESAGVLHLHLNAHHLIVDAWTLNQVSRDTWAEYARLVPGAGPAPEEASRAPSYREFAAADAAYQGSPEREAARAFHRAALDGVVPVLFPRSPERPADAAARRGHHTFTLGKDLVARIRAGGSSPFAYLTAVFATYLARVHRSEEIVLGVPFLNRVTDAERATAGQFANNLPLRVPVSEGATLRELAGLVRERTGAVRAHERLALGDVLRDLPAGTAGSRQLFDVVVSYLRYPRPAALPGAGRDTVITAPVHEQDALSVLIRAFGEENETADTADADRADHADNTDTTDTTDDAELRVELDYATDVFDADFPIEAVAGQLATLVRAGLDEPERPALELPVLTAAERAGLARAQQGPEAAYRSDATLHGLIEEQAARTPDRVAVTAADGGTLTFAELEARANRVAHALRAEGVTAGDRVAVLLERGPLTVPALLGVLKSGAAYVPVDPGYPAERIAFLLQDSRARAVLTGPGAPEPDVPAGVPVLDTERLVAEGPTDRPDPVAGPRDLAYVIYTSGSTGRPKGVMVEHHSVINRLAWMQQRYPVGDGDTLLQKTPVSFDVSVWELFWWAVEGAGLALLPVGGERDPRTLLDTVAERRVSVLHFVPSMLGPFLDLLEAEPGLVARAASLRRVFCSGEALPAARVEQFARVLGGLPDAPGLTNLYGPTEATVDVSYHDCPTVPGRPVRRVPIGAPVANTALRVLDPYGEPQPVGIPGELCVGGVQVARGYLERPELTAEKFTEDPFAPGGRLYRTGDLARLLAGGEIEYLGRIDGQVKIRGNRVELGEVQNALASLDGIRDAVVVDHHSTDRGTRLIGYYVPRVAGEEHDPVALRAELARSLPEFMIPAVFIRIPAVPLTPNGKADRRALPDPVAAAPVRREHTGPRNAAEAALAAVWSEVLGADQVGVDDDYFALGGDSILMLRVRALAERRGYRFDLSDLVRNPTVAALAPLTTAGEAGPESPDPEPFALVSGVDRARLEGHRDAWPANRLQLGLLFHSRVEPDSGVYRDVFRYSFAFAGWDPEAFTTAHRLLVARHPALRSSFDLGGHAEPLQIVDDTVEGALEIRDLRGTPAEEAERAIAAHIEERRHHRYVFEQAPLHHLRAHVLPESVELVLSFHHAILDGGSVATLMRELLQDYAHLLGEPIGAVPDAPVAMAAHHVLAERRVLESAEAREHWTGYLAGAPQLQPAGFRPHEAPGSGEQITRRVDLSGELVDAVRQFSRDHTLPVKSVLFTAHLLTLRMFSGQDDLVTGLVTHGRPEREGAERAAGLFLNTMPVRVTGTPESWLGAVREAFRQEQESHPYRRYPLSAIQEDLGHGVLDTAFNYIHFRQLAEVFALPGITSLDFRTWEETNFALLVNAVTEPDGDGIWLRMDYQGRLFTEDQAELYGRAFTGILERVVQHAAEPVDFGFLAAPLGPVPAARPAPDVVRAFEERAARTPGAVALVHGDRRWSYAELADAADRAARRLAGLGAGPGARVGIAMERSPETIAVLLGVLKAGAATVPLDTAYPRERIAAMLAQAAPVAVVTHATDETDAAHTAQRLGGADGAPVVPAAALLDEGPGTGAAGSVTTGAPGATGTGATGSGAAEGGLPAALDPESVAYLLFTSGSTGAPKGVEMPHRALANLVAWQNGEPSGVVGGVTVQYAPTSFDVSFQEIFSTLCGGGTLLLLSEEQRRDLPALLRLLDRERVERLYLPYVALQQLAETAQALGTVPGSLKAILSSGEQLRITDEIRALCAALPGVILENQYGPTESHVVTRHTMTGDPAAFPPLPPIGVPVDGAEVLVLDSRMRPVPPGVTGELHLGGACLALGYAGRPDLTDERFVARPGGAPGERLYRTGDLGYVLPDGSVVCTGRSDSQVKVRGYRVEPAEVELAITRFAADHPGLAEAAVVARRRDGNDSFLAAFLVGDPDRTELPQLVKQLRSVLPDYLVPSHFQWVDALPLTPSGKRDDRSLRELPLTATTGSGETTAPRDAYEKALTEILRELLGVPGLGVHDNIFELGATSLTAMRLVVLIEQRYGTAVPLSEFVAAPTVAELAARLRGGGAVAGFDPLVPIRTGGTERPLFFVHPMGGNVLCYVRFAAHLPDDRPFYALQAAGVDAGTEPLRSVEEIAASYVARIREVQPEGPYLIGGWSFGGFVSFEMARQLRAQGQEVRRLVLLDTTALNPGRRLRTSDDALLSWFFWELLWLRRGGDSPEEVIPAELTTLEEKFDFIAQLAVDEGVLPAGATGAVVHRLFQVYEANWRAAFAYRPEVVDQDLVLIHATEPLPEVLDTMHTAIQSMHRDPTNGWRERTSGELTVIDVPGDHLTIMEEPHIAHVVEVVAGLIAE
ncbi:amino acid adenylation domain-containing protein [Streptomyces sp. LP05-1]|uniref:Amino acid adenylation domain-containing protein n=1 Tax=Streptomyces pyxinae TaxID=2970734 RepID=A0ABT2CB11_9ACTN|nr:non-ribosomal peptide synthetase [Streptomyces sp. LP05-1]MCS0634587.1 amino acid adenylation domain-containing protein [Streptomyces sp. LP05-1]